MAKRPQAKVELPPFDTSRIDRIKRGVQDLMKEFLDNKEAESCLTVIMKQLEVLQATRSSSKKRKVLNFEDIGVQEKFLNLTTEGEASLIATSAIKSEHVNTLVRQICEIGCHFGRNGEASSRLMINAVLLALAEVSSDSENELPVVILPDMPITSEHGVLIPNETTQYQAWPDNIMDYAICTFENERDRSKILKAAPEQLGLFAQNRVSMIQAMGVHHTLEDSIPEVASQAIAFCEIFKKRMTRFCLSNGYEWLLALVVVDEKDRIVYRGPTYTIWNTWSDDKGRATDVQKLLAILLYWLKAENDATTDPVLQFK